MGVLSSHDSFIGLTDEQKKVRKAQQFGVRIVPELQEQPNKGKQEIYEDDVEEVNDITVLPSGKMCSQDFWM